MHGRGGSQQGSWVGCLFMLLVLGVIGGVLLFQQHQRDETRRREEAGQQARRDAARKEAGELAAAFDARDRLAVDGFNTPADRVRSLQAAYPSESAAAVTALAGWLRRADEALNADLDAAPAGDAEAYKKHHTKRKELATASAAERPVPTAEERWAERTARVVIDAAREQAKTDPPAARTKYADCRRLLSDLPAVASGPKFLAARTRLCAAALDAGRWQMQPLVAADNYERAAAGAKAVAAEWKDEATATGLTDEYAKFADGFAYLAALDKLAKQKP